MANVPQARLTDKVKIDCPHGPQTGTIVSASPYSFADMLGFARLGDTVVCDACGASGQIISGSKFTFIDMKPSARVGDTTTGTCDPGKCKKCPHGRTGTIIQGSPYSFLS